MLQYLLVYFDVNHSFIIDIYTEDELFLKCQQFITFPVQSVEECL